MSSREDVPQSVEEAGALVGAAITRCGVKDTAHTTELPPKGMHSSFATVSPVPSSELFLRLHSLRSLLKSAPSTSPLVAAPSLLAVLMKLLGVSNSLAIASAPASSAVRAMTSPMLSTPLRQLWVDCVVLCHGLGEGLSGAARLDVLQFVRNMTTLAGLNPKSLKAAGGTRMAALQVIGGLFLAEKLQTKLAPWALDVVQLCHRSLRSSGSGEPSFRIAAVQTACSVAIACREASLKSRPAHEGIIQSAMEDKAILESTRLIRLATADKFPEVRNACANFVSILAPMLIHSGPSSFQKSSSEGFSGASSTLASSLEEVMILALRNVDDEMAGVAVAWAEALAQCLCVCIAYGQLLRSENDSTSSRRSATGGDDGGAGEKDSSRTASRKGSSIVQQCATLPLSLAYLVDNFIKAGGELAASRQGGHYSAGGRAVRIGLSLTMVKLLGLQQYNVGPSRALTSEDAIASILNMVGPDLEKQLKVSESRTNITLDATSVSVQSPEKHPSLFGVGRNKSRADAGLARAATNRVLRQGLSEMAPESSQLTILHELIAMCMASETDEEDEKAANSLTAHQLQVVLIEISHLLTTLGAAAASSLTDLIPALQACLGHSEHGVRHEAAIACAAVSGTFPTKARKLFKSSLDEIQVQYAEIFKLASMDEELPSEEGDGSPGHKRRFGRNEAKPAHPSLVHQYAVHGHSLMVSLLLRDLPHLPGGLPNELLTAGSSVAEILVNCQYNDILTKGNPGAACTCVRAGYGIICGALTVGPTAITPHIDMVFGLWRRVGEGSASAVKNFTNDQDLICLDAALASIVAFLTHCSELLLLSTDALTSSTLMLEKLLPLFMGDDRLASTPANHVAASRHESAKASLMEAFAWLPPGSFPMIADKVFAFAAAHIRSGIEAEVMCSLLPTLVNNEDEVLDAKSLPRAQRCGQVGGAKDIEENLIHILSEVAHHGERESVLFFRTNKTKQHEERELRGSRVLGLFACDDDEPLLPTPLHAVGTWRQPVSPSSRSKVRLLDAAVQCFSATFGLKDGKEQHNAMLMLESLVPPLLVQLARAIGVDTALVEPERRSKTKDDHAAIANITAVLLACLEALPLHEATHDIPIGLGPPWMNKAKDLLLALLPATSNIVRRAAAEGLALLATLGVTEDAHTLQSTVLHSLDEVMQGNQPDGKPRAIPVAPVSAARAGSLLTLACIQRTTHQITEKHRARARGRSSTNSAMAEIQSDALPTIQMMTRIIPSVACHGVLRDREAFVVRTYAMHSFGLIIAYSSRLDQGELSRESLQLLKKAVEVVEDNFLAAWTAVSSVFDGGQEAEKLAAEASFLAVLLRLMTFLVPSLSLLASTAVTIGERFAAMAHVMLDSFAAHPVVFVEGMAFFDQLSLHQSLLPSASKSLLPSQDYLTSSLPFLLEGLTPERPTQLACADWLRCTGVRASVRGELVAALCAKLLSTNQVLCSGTCEEDLVASLFSMLEVACGRRMYAGESLYRPLASNRQADISGSDQVSLEIEIARALDTMVILEENSDSEHASSLLHWILFTRCLLTGSVEKPGDESNDEDPYTLANAKRLAKQRASESALRVFEFASPVRWQTRCQAARSATLALQSISKLCMRQTETSPHFCSETARRLFAGQSKELKAAQVNASEHLSSFVVFHAGEVLSAACSSSVATLDQSELWHVQEGGIRLLKEIVSCIGDTGDMDNPGDVLLDQYLSQMLSCVKHALTAYTDDDEDDAEKLFILGCEALQTIVENKLVTDPMVLKRLIRPVLLAKTEVQFFGYEETPDRNWLPTEEDSSFKNFRLTVLPVIGKLWTLGKLRGLAEDGVMSESVAVTLFNEMKECKSEVASYSAAVAIDGARLLNGCGLSLCGTTLDEPSIQRDGEEKTQSSGFMFDDIHDLDNLVKTVLAQAWSSCACDAMFNIIDVIQASDDVGEATRVACCTWLKKLTPVVFAGLRDSFSVYEAVDLPTRVDFTKGLSTEEVMASCLRALCALLKGADPCRAELISSWSHDLAFVVGHVSTLILFPVCSVKVTTIEESVNPVLVMEACHFVEVLADSATMSNGVESAFLVAVLTPLDAVQKGEITLENYLVANVVASCLTAAHKFVKNGSAKDALVYAMLQLSLEMLSKPKSSVPDAIGKASEVLLSECLESDPISISPNSEIASEMAQDGNWEAWAFVCSHSSNVALLPSMSYVKVALSDLQSTKNHLAALSAVRHVISSAAASSNDSCVDLLMQGVGAQVLGLLQAYGTLAIIPNDSDYNTTKEVQDQGVTAFADCMKVIMTAYQSLAQKKDDHVTTAFLSVVLNVWTCVIAYNGLPNHTSPHRGADATLGKLSAQAIVHVARTSPIAFKSSILTLSEQSRALIEFSVRADLGGYASVSSQQQATPTKKKISLQGFTK